MAGHDDDTGEPDRQIREPHHVRAIDAFNAFYRQLGVVGVRIAELETALERRTPTSIVLAIADLNHAWSVLDARLDLLEAVTNDDAGRELWTLPAMQMVRESSRKVLAQGIAYVERHGAPASALLVQLHQLTARLRVHDQVASSVADAGVPAGEAPTHDVPPTRIYVVGPPRGRARPRCAARSGPRRPRRPPAARRRRSTDAS